MAETRTRETLTFPDLREKGGPKNGEPQFLDRRLFMQLTAFGGGADAKAMGQALDRAGIAAVVYEELADPRGAAVLAVSEDPAYFLDALRPTFNLWPFDALAVKGEFAMLGRTYSLGYEPNLEDWLLKRPRRVIADAAAPWAVWYPLRRTGSFALLPHAEQMAILKEHGVIGRSFGEGGYAQDIRLSCAGLDKNDNDFVIGLIGKELYPLSALVEAMRKTRQTSTYLANLGPFFVGRAVWRSRLLGGA